MASLSAGVCLVVLAATGQTTVDAHPGSPGNDPHTPGATLLAAVLERAGRYVAHYEDAFRNIAAEERYEQLTSDGCDQDGRARAVTSNPPSAAALTVLPGAMPWSFLREVLGVDEVVALRPSPRTLSAPTVALSYLRLDNQDRFHYALTGRTPVGVISALQISFTEKARPTLHRDGTPRDAPLRGAFWIHDSDGTVLRSRWELPLRVASGTTGSLTVTTEYRYDRHLGLFVPVEMRETLCWSIEPTQRGRSCGSIDGTARYSAFRRLREPAD